MRSAIYLLAVLIAWTHPAPTQETSDNSLNGLPKGWEPAPSKDQNGALWHCARHSLAIWTARNENGEIKIKEYDVKSEVQEPLPAELKGMLGRRGRLSIQRTPRGRLVGFDAGEFGGGLWLLSSEGYNPVHLLTENVHAIFQTPSGIRVLVGLSHLGMDYGAVYGLEDTPETVATRLADLGGSPQASALDENGNILVATPHSVLRLDASDQIHEIYESHEPLIHPTSITKASDGTLYVGMAFFVLRLERQADGYRGTWLMSEKCRTFEESHYFCACTAADQK